MKIWKAELILNYTIDNKWDVWFEFKAEDKEYKFNDNNTEWLHSEEWICDRVPIEISIENLSYSTGFKIVQGFNKELNKNELEELKGKMKELANKKLEIQKSQVLKEFEEKLPAINNFY